jgi:glutathione gamma-glutamylcysteinyltransferase
MNSFFRTKEQFINDLKQSCQSSNEYMVISYFRGTLNQTGTGHFSPIAGYNEKEGKALVLDVARFKVTLFF